MLSEEQIDNATVCLAEMLMQAVQVQAKRQSKEMVVDFSKNEEDLDDDDSINIDYSITIPVRVIRAAIRDS